MLLGYGFYYFGFISLRKFRKQAFYFFLLFIRTFQIYFHESIKLDDLAAGSEDIFFSAGGGPAFGGVTPNDFGVNARCIKYGFRHLGSNCAFPNQVVKSILVPVQMIFDA